MERAVEANRLEQMLTPQLINIGINIGLSLQISIVLKRISYLSQYRNTPSPSPPVTGDSSYM